MNKSKLFKDMWFYVKEYGYSKRKALRKAWEQAKNKVTLSDDLSMNDCWHLSWEQVKAYFSSIEKRTKTFYSIAKLVYEKGKFSTHKAEFKELYWSVKK